MGCNITDHDYTPGHYSSFHSRSLKSKSATVVVHTSHFLNFSQSQAEEGYEKESHSVSKIQPRATNCMQAKKILRFYHHAHANN